jgi:hypothetical protein
MRMAKFSGVAPFAAKHQAPDSRDRYRRDEIPRPYRMQRRQVTVPRANIRSLLSDNRHVAHDLKVTLGVSDDGKIQGAKRQAGNQQVLWEVWDPIGVNSDPKARDEYSFYVNGIFELLEAGASDEELAEKLLFNVTERMELQSATLDHMRPTVAALRHISDTSDDT